MPIILRDIIGTDMKIQLSIQGTVKYQDPSIGWVKIEKHLGKNKHHYVDIEIEGEVITKRVDKLVLRHFKGKRPSKKHTEVIHLDGDIYNHLDDNLKWATKKELKAFKIEFAARPKPVQGKKGRGVKVIDNRSKTETLYDSPSDAAKAIGMTPSKLRQSIRGKLRINDFTFEYTT